MRECRRALGELVQMDGSEHDWFEGRGDRASLMVMIDDATNWTHAKFFPSETTAAAMTVFQEYVGYYGLPRRCTWIGTVFTKPHGIPRWTRH